jgi:hypothetical protein
MRRSAFRAPRHGERLGHEFTRHCTGPHQPVNTEEVTMVVRRDEAIRGTAIPQKGRRPRRIAEERMCSADDCSTKLSVYNRTDVCWIHEEPHPFVLDGVRKRRDEPIEPSSGPLRVA